MHHASWRTLTPALLLGLSSIAASAQTVPPATAPDAASAGPHFNPVAKKHGAPDSTEHHGGDLGNLNANEYGKATLSIMVDGISVGKGADGVIGRGVIVHAKADDLKTDPAGNSGERIGCGVVEG